MGNDGSVLVCFLFFSEGGGGWSDGMGAEIWEGRVRVRGLYFRVICYAYSFELCLGLGFFERWFRVMVLGEMG